MKTDSGPLTVITGDRGWHSSVADALAHALTCRVSQHSNHPLVIILEGGFSEEEIRRVVRYQRFSSERFTGLDNSELPFEPSFQ